MIPDEIIQEVKRRVDLGEVIGRTVGLKKRGRNLVGLCPFHEEKTPSFNVRPDEGFYKCFGCGAAGDVFSFLEHRTGASFLDVIRTLAAETGVEIPDVKLSPAEQRRREEKRQLVRALELTQIFFRQRLLDDAEGRLARAYLAEARQLSEEELVRFGVGYGGTRPGALLKFLADAGIPAATALAAGVATEGQSGAYELFLHRATFPIRAPSGEIVAFGGRIFGPRAEGRPKYVNSPTTALYDKSRTLYGLHEALPVLRKGTPAVLVEGYLDVIAVARAGIGTGVAPCGTAFGPGHIETLARHAKGLVIALDGDDAGQRAARIAVARTLSAGLDVGLAVLPGQDPDDMVRAEGPEALRKALVAKPALEVLIAATKERASASVSARLEALQELLPLLRAPPDELVRRQWIRFAALALAEDEALLLRQVDEKGPSRLASLLGTPRPKAPERTAAPPAATSSRPPNAPRAVVPVKKRKTRVPFTPAERGLVRALLCHPLWASRCAVLVDVLRHDELRQWLVALEDTLDRFHDEDPVQAMQRVPLRPKGEIIRIVAEQVTSAGGRIEDLARFMTASEAERLIEDFVVHLDRRALEARIAALQAAIEESERVDDQPRLRALVAEKHALRLLPSEGIGALPAGTSPAARAGPAAAEIPASAALPAGPQTDDVPLPPLHSEDEDVEAWDGV